MKQLLSGADSHTTCILRALYYSSQVQFCELDACSGRGALNELILSIKNKSPVSTVGDDSTAGIKPH